MRLQRFQTWSSMLVEIQPLRVIFFNDAPSEATCAPPSRRAQRRPLSARPDFGPNFGPYFWVLPSDFFFFPAEGLQACKRPTHWFPRLKQLLCVRESESRMLRSFGPVHARARSLWCPCVFCSPRREKIAVHDLPKLQPQAYLVDVSPTPFLRLVSVWQADLDLGGRMCVWTLRDFIK